MLECQRRMVGEMEWLSGRHRGESVALVSHGDIIRSALLWGLGMAIDHYSRLEIRTGSVSVLSVEEWGVAVQGVNWS